MAGGMCGVCGDANGDKTDDLKTADGTETEDKTQIVASHLTEDQPERWEAFGVTFMITFNPTPILDVN